jgi:beta-glucanase (GH16 family)
MRSLTASRTRALGVLLAAAFTAAACFSSDSTSNELGSGTNSKKRGSLNDSRGPQTTRPTDGKLLLDESFNGSTLNRSRWTTCYWWAETTCTNASNNELELYTPDNVAVASGRLRLEARRERAESEDGKTFDYTSGLISGSGRNGTMKKFRYGYVEARVRVPKGTGLWSAVWLLPASQESRPEIDVFEIVGEKPRRVVQSLHFGDRENRQNRRRDVTTSDITEGWHRFGLLWEPTRLAWYIDDEETFVITKRDQIPDVPMYLIANLAVGGDFTTTPDAATPFPSTMEIDYIRVWDTR